MNYRISDVNRALETDARGFITQCEQDYRRSIVETAEKIADNRAHSPIVLLAGPSGSGKTTTAHILAQELMELGLVTHPVSIDDYFRTVDYRTAPRTPEGEIDYESPKCVDMELLSEHFDALSRGEEIKIPRYIFARQKRSASIFHRLRLGKNEIAIFEGIHALNDEITAPHPEAFKLYVSASTDFADDTGLVRFDRTWLRLVRRVVRDNNFRGASAAYTIEMWGNVLRGERLYIDPYKQRADVMINSALPYEVGVMKGFGEPLFRDIPADVGRKDELKHILPAFRLFDPVPAELVPESSLLREFIGNSMYDFG